MYDLGYHQDFLCHYSELPMIPTSFSRLRHHQNKSVRRNSTVSNALKRSVFTRFPTANTVNRFKNLCSEDELSI